MVKAVLDRVVASILFIILIPVFIIISVLIKIDSKGSVFFLQERVGKDKKLFNIYKFRTMVPAEFSIDKDGILKSDKDRITPLGNFLRNTSLDEIPQLINIIKGDMSFIGPRPTLKYQVEKYDSFQLGRLKMKPGISGWAQVNGRNNLTWEEKIKLDIYYIENYSLWLDFKILLKTVKVVFDKSDVEFTKEDFLSKQDSGKIKEKTPNS